MADECTTVFPAVLHGIPSRRNQTRLDVPSLPLRVPARVFTSRSPSGGDLDGFRWCESDELILLTPRNPEGTPQPAEGNAGLTGGAGVEAAVDLSTSIDGSDPARMVFVFHAPCDFLPQELARFHALGLGFQEELALAPWGIDAATDELFARRCRPRNLFVLAADNLNALFWGLHDWAHFHNHGPLDEPALTELQCDSAALVWMWRNRGALGLTEARWEKARGEVSALNGRRFRDEGLSFDDHLLDPKILWDLAKNLAKPGSRKPLPDECAIAAPP